MEVARLSTAVRSVPAWPSTAAQAGAPHSVWGFSAASNADRVALLQALLDLESARLQVPHH